MKTLALGLAARLARAKKRYLLGALLLLGAAFSSADSTIEALRGFAAIVLEREQSTKVDEEDRYRP